MSLAGVVPWTAAYPSKNRFNAGSTRVIRCGLPLLGIANYLQPKTHTEKLECGRPLNDREW